MNLLEWPYRLKSARRKRRLVKTDRDKQLIQLNRQEKALWKKQSDLPMIPLEHPYQRGWKRFFVLRKDVQESPKAEFYQSVLDKINTVEYSVDQSFKRRKRRKQRYHYVQKPQSLRHISEDNWLRNKLKLTDAEKECFYRNEDWLANLWRMEVSYKFLESWRFVLVIKPRIISEVKKSDEVLQQEIAEIDAILDRNKVSRLYNLNGKRVKYRRDYVDKPKYINPLKNKPVYNITELYPD